MGKRIYVAVKHNVSYDSSAGFNWHNEEFKDLLSNLNVDIWNDNGDYTDGYGDSWECTTKAFDNALNFLKDNKDNILNYENGKTLEVNDSEVDAESVYDAIMELECGEDFSESYDEVVSMMELWKKQRAKRNKYMFFCAF